MENACHYTENTRRDKGKAEKSAVGKTLGFSTALYVSASRITYTEQAILHSSQPLHTVKNKSSRAANGG
ncbi:hypothetical protein HMPREF9996_00274 [Aggregatibacter actinomycetemcomitans Y4]|nr:hypothetical protein HMPREF9996_00274 [Aggregatibacter actinomycetemcomitans Y4]